MPITLMNNLKTVPQYSMPQTKAPPQNIDAEKAVLGAVLIDNEALNKVLEVIKSADFYVEGHRKIYDSMAVLYERGEPTDFLTVSNHLKQQGLLDFIGGASYLSSLADTIPSSANILSYAKIIKEKAIIRKLIEASTEIATLGYEGAQDAEEMLDRAEKIIFDMTENRSRPTFRILKEVVKESFKKIEQLFESKKSVTGLSSGFRDFDNMTSGLQPGDLIILAARPSMGKTSLAVNIAESAAIHEKASVAIFSLEMGMEQLGMRMLCSQARIDSSKLRRGDLEDRDWPALTKAAGVLSEVKLHIDDTPAQSVLEMRAKCRRLKKEHGLDLVIVDYLQLARGSSGVSNREQEISEISRGLKSIAKELKVPVIALSQLNRAVESRTNRRPMLSDLRESGAIEQDADIIMFIYRDEVYDANSPDKGIAEIIIGKQRNGPVGTVRLAFLNQYTKFENLAVDHASQYSSDAPDY